jgi:eukaryotic-like serine/threonine-protein kinase
MPETATPRHATWEFAEGDEIAPGRTILRTLGGGSRYEVQLVWDDRLFAVMVAKVLRPDQVEDPVALRDLRKEAEALARLAHPVLVRGFGAVLDGPYPHVLIEHLEGPTLRARGGGGGGGGRAGGLGL